MLVLQTRWNEFFELSHEGKKLEIRVFRDAAQKLCLAFYEPNGARNFEVRRKKNDPEKSDPPPIVRRTG